MPHATHPSHRPRRDRLHNRERILEAYVALLAGGRSPGVDEVADAAGIGRSTVYRHFGDIRGLQVAAVFAAIEQLNRVIAEVRGSRAPAEEVLGTVAATAVDLSRRFALASVNWPMDDRELNRRFDALLAPLTALVAARQRTGELEDGLPAEVLAEAFVGLVQAVAIHQAHLPGPAAADAVLRLFLAGCGSAGASRSGHGGEG